jgi:hypothetical protein
LLTHGGVYGWPRLGVLLQARVRSGVRHFPKPAPLFSQGPAAPLRPTGSLRLLWRIVMRRTTASEASRSGAAACGQSPKRHGAESSKLRLSQCARALDQ